MDDFHKRRGFIPKPSMEPHWWFDTWDANEFNVDFYTVGPQYHPQPSAVICKEEKCDSEYSQSLSEYSPQSRMFNSY